MPQVKHCKALEILGEAYRQGIIPKDDECLYFDENGKVVCRKMTEDEKEWNNLFDAWYQWRGEVPFISLETWLMRGKPGLAEI